jgi:hypothetical protein
MNFNQVPLIRLILSNLNLKQPDPAIRYKDKLIPILLINILDVQISIRIRALHTSTADQIVRATVILFA